MQYITEKEYNTIRGKMLVGAATQEEVMSLLHVTAHMEILLELADDVDALGTEGWRHDLGWDA